jgi:hypothetical protein
MCADSHQTKIIANAKNETRKNGKLTIQNQRVGNFILAAAVNASGNATAAAKRRPPAK